MPEMTVTLPDSIRNNKESIHGHPLHMSPLRKTG